MSETSLPALLDRAERLYRDANLDAVRRWKERSGGLAIGFMPIYAPCELLHAQGVLPVGIMGGGDDLEIIRGDAYYQSYICHIPRSTIELGLNGALDCLDGMIFPAICDVIRNLSGMWKLQFPDKLSRYLDVPQEFSPEIGGRFYRNELEELSRELTHRGARPYDEEALRESIKQYNDTRRQVRGLYALRQRAPWKVPSSELYLILRAGLLLPVDEFDGLLRAYAGALESDTSRQPMDQARVLVTGSFCEQPRYHADDDKGQALVQRAKQSRAEGVLFCAPSFCDPALLDQPMAVKAVERARIPWTAFKYSENTGQFQVIREQAGTFADSIKLWSGE
jgi:benzoyl-CoA reductase subunit C